MLSRIVYHTCLRHLWYIRDKKHHMLFSGFFSALFFHYSCSDCISVANRAPSMNSYSNNPSSERLAYLLQQSWNLSNISFCSSVIVLSKLSLFRLKYSNSFFISGVLYLLFSGGMTLPRHSFFIVLFINRTSCQHTTIPQKVAGVQTFFKMKMLFSFGVIFDSCEANIEP